MLKQSLICFQIPNSVKKKKMQFHEGQETTLEFEFNSMNNMLMQEI